jgi:AcrR family transcriptional regulator
MSDPATSKASKGRSTGAPRPAPRSGNALGAATRERIILAAERVFAERGIASVSLREIALAAGQRNNAVIQYHFGDRERLLLAAIEHRAAETSGMRVRMLADLLSRGREPDVVELVEAIVLPSASQLLPDNHYLGLQARLVAERGPFHVGFGTPTLLDGHPDATWSFLREALHRKLVHLPELIFVARWDIALNTSILTLAGYQKALSRGTLEGHLDVLVSDLVSLLAGALSADFLPRDLLSSDD